MADYALIDDATHEILKEVDSDRRFRDGTPPDLSSKPFSWVPIVVVNPDFDRETQIKEPMVEVVTDTEVTRTRTVRDKTADELQDDVNRKIGNSDHLLARVVEDILVNVANGTPLTRDTFHSKVWQKVNQRLALRGQEPV